MSTEKVGLKKDAQSILNSLKKERWVRGAFVDDRGRRCLLGHIQHVVPRYLSFNGWERYEAAKRLYREVIEDRQGQYDPQLGDSDVIMFYNDHHAQFEDVREVAEEVLRRASQ